MPPDISTRQLIEQLAERAAEPALTLGELLDQFRSRAFGVFLLVSLLPAFLPVPVGMGAISGPLVSLIGLQMLLRLDHPWLPRRLSRHTLAATTLVRFRDRTRSWLHRLERVSRPRNEFLIDHPAASSATGGLMLLLGVLLALPIPLTNYPFALVLLFFAVALIERDGRVMLVAWVLGAIELLLFALFSQQIAGWITSYF